MHLMQADFCRRDDTVNAFDQILTDRGFSLRRNAYDLPKFRRGP